MSTDLRDRFFALSTGTASADEVARYRAEVDATDAEPAAFVDGLAVSWHPTARFKAVRFVDADRIDAPTRELFARPSEGAPHLAAVFVDPRELSFRTFENIVPLDRLFADVPLDLTLAEPEELARGVYSARLRLPDAGRARVEGLDGLGLYVPPLNSGSRGGERFIFHSALLADALTKAVSAALPEAVLDGFLHVNPVFRCNRFEPGDANFHHHLDTPYYDAARGHVSRHTLLLYLTGGSGEPALDLSDGVALTDIAPFTCVVFDQRYEHEGAPYRDGRKVFLRTELVFEQAGSEVAHAPEIGALFSKACYLTGESVFAPELAAHADAYYNQVAAAHWNGPSDGAAASEPFVHKRFRGVDFVANGYDFWFARQEGISLAECAAITLLDYFNCKLGDSAFRDVCESSVIEAAGTDWIPGFLTARRDERGGGGERAADAVAAFDKSLLFPESEETNDACCPFHSFPEFVATRFDEIVDLNETAQTFARAHIMPAPILMLGQDVVLDPARFQVRGNQIHVLGRESLAPVNFAACWNAGGTPANYIDVAATVDAAHFLVPPIFFTETDDCYHLRFDFFRNTWMAKHRQVRVPVPMIRDYDDMDFDPDDWDSSVPAAEAVPWIAAAERALGRESDGGPGAAWWVEQDPAGDKELRELLETAYEYDHDEEDDEDEEDDGDGAAEGGE
ncbi:hypothetical protein AQ490_08550 [Wenjunlia vitaminophila]|uniref:Fe2OG dioxygenase domain-containing protein n=1 Tax=Wenjunlia vitaminophila TaxID=76728 RepID=A0A0T6LLV3_WENVI|nr:hypothetical protein [Wenjunlia vitaminophila]KRV46828.1 hypothetical protein AQ490_08550 [Wenjunlia vitaminophila]